MMTASASLGTLVGSTIRQPHTRSEPGQYRDTNSRDRHSNHWPREPAIIGSWLLVQLHYTVSSTRRSHILGA